MGALECKHKLINDSNVKMNIYLFISLTWDDVPLIEVSNHINLKIADFGRLGEEL